MIYIALFAPKLDMAPQSGSTVCVSISSIDSHNLQIIHLIFSGWSLYKLGKLGSKVD